MAWVKRHFCEVSPDVTDSASSLPFSWHNMPNGDFARFSLYESCAQLKAWTTNSAYYMDTACFVLQGTFKATFITHMNFAAYSKCIMWNDLCNTPTLNGYVKVPNIPLALTQPMVKKACLDSKVAFDLLEKERMSRNVEYYEIVDDQKDAGDSFTQRFKSIAHLNQVVEELEKIHILVKGVDMYQNRKMLAYHNAFCTIEGLNRTDAVMMYHGTSEVAINGGLLDAQVGHSAAVGGIISCGLNENRAQRTMFGRGIYVSADFEIAKRFAMEEHNINGSTAVVLMLSCYLGKIRQVNRYSANLDSFVDEEGELCHTKFVQTLNYHILSTKAQACVRYGIRFQWIDNVNIFPAKIQLARDKKLQQLEIHKAKMEKLQAEKLELETDMALLTTTACHDLLDHIVDVHEVGKTTDKPLANAAASNAIGGSSKDTQTDL